MTRALGLKPSSSSLRGGVDGGVMVSEMIFELLSSQVIRSPGKKVCFTKRDNFKGIFRTPAQRGQKTSMRVSFFANNRSAHPI